GEGITAMPGFRFSVHTAMTRYQTPATATFIGAAGNKLVADVFGDRGSPVLLRHGGGQSHHAMSAMSPLPLEDASSVSSFAISDSKYDQDRILSPGRVCRRRATVAVIVAATAPAPWRASQSINSRQ